MDERWYQRTTRAEMQKGTYRTTVQMQNGNMVVPVGSIVKIIDKQGGLYLLGPACPHCGVRVKVSKVTPHCVELVEEADA